MESTLSRKTALSLALYTGVALLAFFPCLFMGKAYFANDLLHQYSNFRALLQLQLAQGHFPLWNPYFFGGQPFFADPNVMMAYPLLYPTLLFPIAYGLSVFFFLHMVLAAAGMHLWLKSLRASEGASRVGALAFALSGFFWWELIHPPILAAFAWFPWVMFCLEKLAQSLGKRWAFAAGLSFAMVFCCGNFQSTSCVLYTGLPYFLFRLLKRDDGTSLPYRRLPAIVLVGLLGSAPLAAHFIPAYEFSKYSNRRDANQTYESFNGQFSMTPASTYELLYPQLGVPADTTLEMAIQQVTDTVNTGNDFLGTLGYIGIWAPFFFVLAFQRRDRRLLFLLAAGGLLALLSAWGRFFPLHRLECMVLPGIDLSRAPFRFIQAFVLFGSALLAFGYQTFEHWTQEKGPRSNWIWAATGYALLLLLAGLSNPVHGWREMFALALGGCGLALSWQSQSWKPLGRAFLWAGLFAPLLFSGWSGYSLGPSSNYDLVSRFPAFDYLRQHRDGGRYYFVQDLRYPVEMGGQQYGWTFPQDAPMVLGIRQNLGYNPIVLTHPQELSQLPMTSYLRLMAVKGLVTGREVTGIPEADHQMIGSAQIYEFKTPPPYLWAPARVQALPDEEQVLARMKAPDFDPWMDGFTTGPQAVPASGPRSGFSYAFLDDQMDQQRFRVHQDREGLVVFSEVMFPGWKAWLDGQPAAILTADHAFRALVVPAGDHEVAFHFEPSWAKPLRWGGLSWLLSALLLGAFLAFKRKGLFHRGDAEIAEINKTS